MPIISATVFDNTAQAYNVTKILTKDFVFDKAAYDNYSRVYLPATYVLSYTLQFAALPALIVHAICWYRQDLWCQFKQSFLRVKVEIAKERRSIADSLLSRQESEDSNVSQPSTAPDLDNLLNEEELTFSQHVVKDDVPNSWYFLIGLSMTAIGIIVVEG
jgi:OPT oligopeptide transporter protein